MVPGGTSTVRSAPVLPVQLAVPPRPPLGARQNLRLMSGARLSASVSARRITWPPSPPSGPPRGSYFSRRKLRQPRPPSPPFTKISTRSTNMGNSQKRVSSLYGVGRIRLADLGGRFSSLNRHRPLHT